MEKLMKPAEYAKELGISRQAVYAKIKRGILTAKNVDGKLYIVVDNASESTESAAESTESEAVTTQKRTVSKKQTSAKDYKALLEAKDETIAVLKDTVKDLKKSNKQISTTLRGEIDLLKDAFHEMRNLYVHQLEHKEAREAAIDVVSEAESVEVIEEQWISVKKFFKRLGLKKEKHQAKLLKRLKKAFKAGDERIIKEEGTLKLDASKQYEDLVK